MEDLEFKIEVVIHISVHLLSGIMLFWGHCTGLNFPLEDDSQLFPGLKSSKPIPVIAILNASFKLISYSL